MNNITFKTGDRVRIINCSSIEPYELNKIGVIVDIDAYDGDEYVSYVVDMGRPRRPGSMEDTETRWWLQGDMIELIGKPNEQLLFDFMNEQGE